MKSVAVLFLILFGSFKGICQSSFLNFSPEMEGGISTAVFKGNNGLIWYSFNQNPTSLERFNRMTFTDFEGNIQKVILPDSSNHFYNYAAITPNGETILTGNYSISGPFGNIGWGLITKLDIDGNIVWSKRATADESGGFTGAYTDGEIIYATFTSYNFFSSSQYWKSSVIAYDLDGNVLWNTPIGYPGLVSNFYFRAATVAENGDFIGAIDVAGSQNVQASGIVLLRITPSGNITWKKFVNWQSDFSHSSVNGLVEGPNGSVYVGCRLMSNQISTYPNDMWIGKFGADGNLTDQRIYKAGVDVGENISGMSKSDNELLVYIKRYSPFENIKNHVDVLGIDFETLTIGTAGSSPVDISRESVYGDDGPSIVVSPDGSIFTSGIVFCELNLKQFTTMMKWTIGANTACISEEVSEIYTDSVSTFGAVDFNLSGGSVPTHASETVGLITGENSIFNDFCLGCDIISSFLTFNQEEIIGFYPNPASESITFNTPIDQFTIVNLSGKVILTGTPLNGHSASLKGMAPGMYLIYVNGKSLKLLITD